ncbi:hypothetical protein [Mycolicibacterium chlorophenolicum]|uniref:Uncharacterized protein n=1 Tax=Mycolicibacterium chlorophenolicum TaxID=37916 RepID=A0A0J6VFL3_9MYCO|nr:hypothetical protein [Mycolicibacterium chlorophenolicum]KMO69805.1 hypothetical protein MCHLDSM_05917 [Mycolicibacterium chlorophenolicum]
MRFIFTVLCMGMIAAAAAALVVIDLIIKLLPVIIVALVALVALRIVDRRHLPVAATPTPPAAICNVPNTAAFVYTAQTAGINESRRAGVVNDGRPPRYAATKPQGRTVMDAEVIDAEVISEDGHDG